MAEEKSILDRITSLVSGGASTPVDDVEDGYAMSAEEEARTKSPMNKLVEDSPMPPKDGDLVEGKVSAVGRARVYVELAPFGTGLIYGREYMNARETELFAATYKSYGLATVRYPVLEVEARVEPFDNGRGFSLRVLRAGPPRQRD